MEERARRAVGSVATFALGVVLAGCVSTAGLDQGQQARVETATVDRPIRMALTNEPGAIAGQFVRLAGAGEYGDLFAARLVREDYLGEPAPQLVSEIPSLEGGTWRILDDGRMETTYRLRPGAVWHDGQPLTPADVIFTWQTILRPDLPATTRDPEQNIESIEASGPNTLLVRWKRVYIVANAWPLQPLPRHILEPLLERDAQAFLNSDYWRTAWVGLGPFQVADWVPGSFIKGRAFPQYVLGAPKVSEVVVYFIADANQAIARALAGDIDLTLGSLIKVEEGVSLKEQLEARGEGTVLTAPAAIRSGEFQFRQPQQPPARDVRVRRGLVHAVDRQQLSDTLYFGLNKPADIFLSPLDGAFPSIDRAITRYPHDPNQALRLFADAGWTRGADGTLQNASGERFRLGVRSSDDSANVKEAQVLAQFWKTVGVEPELEFYGPVQQNDREYRALYPGFALGSPGTDILQTQNYLSTNIATEATRWSGSNRGAYVNPDIDGLINEYFVTIDAVRRVNLLVDYFRIVTSDVPGFPLYYRVDVYGVRTGLKGVAPTKPGEAWTTANAHLLYWDR